MASSGGGSSSVGCGVGASPSDVVTKGTAAVLGLTAFGDITELGAVGDPCPPHDPMISAATKRNTREAIDLADVNI
jgi:hypothetical protein